MTLTVEEVRRRLGIWKAVGIELPSIQIVLDAYDAAVAQNAELRAGLSPCGCTNPACEQYPEQGLIYYGRICRARDSRP